MTPFGLVSPNGSRTAFSKDYNLWVRDYNSGNEHQWSEGGGQDCFFAGAGDSTVFSKGNMIDAVWSPDSRRILTVQSDYRGVNARPLVHYVNDNDSLRPTVESVKVAFSGDKVVEKYRLWILDAVTGASIEADYPAIPFSTYTFFDYLTTKPMAWWSADSRCVYFLDIERGAKAVRLVEMDAKTGATRIIFEEVSDTFIKLSHSTLNEIPLFEPIPGSEELIWFSERTGWGHLYLYDLNSGQLKHPITQGNWLVRQVIHFSAERRELLIQTAGRDESISPYYRDICKVNIDSGEMMTLVSGNYDFTAYLPECFNVSVYHRYGLMDKQTHCVSPNGEYLVTTRSRVDAIPETILIDHCGNEICVVETSDVSGLPENWVWPESLKLKANDGETDIYGVMYRPPGYSEDNKYPVIDFSCGIRNHSCVPHGSFINGFVFDLFYLWGAALAALGFIVVALEARGSPYRSKAFQDYKYGDPASDGEVLDRVAAINQLAQKYPYMDITRVGLSSGDNVGSAMYGMLKCADFYKVAVIHHYTDARFSIAPFGESYEGVPVDGSLNPNVCYAEDRVGDLKGKLLLIQGMLDINTPSATFRIVEALEKANKDFDMLCRPKLHHDVDTYSSRKNWGLSGYSFDGCRTSV